MNIYSKRQRSNQLEKLFLGCLGHVTLPQGFQDVTEESYEEGVVEDRRKCKPKMLDGRWALGRSHSNEPLTSIELQVSKDPNLSPG